MLDRSGNQTQRVGIWVVIFHVAVLDVAANLIHILKQLRNPDTPITSQVHVQNLTIGTELVPQLNFGVITQCE